MTVLLVIMFLASPTPAAAACYVSYLEGNAADAPAIADARRRGGLVLMGGGEKLVNAFAWMIDRMGGPGDFVVLRTSDYNTFTSVIAPLPGLDSVEELVVPTRDCASDPYVVRRLAEADAVFISGGDQSTYVGAWAGTLVTTILDEAMRRGVPVGGTSAGLAVLGEYAYSAAGGSSATSAEALADPFATSVTLARNFLRAPFLEGIVTDTHFVARDRMGRLVAFLGRIRSAMPSDAPVGPRAIAVDEDAALLLETRGHQAGRGHVVASSNSHNLRTVYFVSTPPGLPERCEPAIPLTYSGLSVTRRSAGEWFDVARWSTDGASYPLSVVRGRLSSADVY